jgi:glycogen debranching enzyme
VEINALWYHALHVMADFAGQLGEDAQPYRTRAAQVQAAFARFWNPALGYCFDVIDGPQGSDPALRPNQLLAVSLPHSPLTAGQQKQVVDACARALVTSMGLRSLAPGEPGYSGIYTGDRYARDGAYHQGTVWAWLIGPFVEAHLRVYGDPALARTFLEPFSHFMLDAGLGSISEIADGDAPFTPRGCPWQAWSVAEVLRAWRLCREG